MTDCGPLKRLEKGDTLVERVVTQIQDLVLSGELCTGHRLPAERQLGESLGVSRTVIREALSALAAKGLIESSLGGGFTVATPTSGDVIPSLTLFLRAGKPHLDYSKVHEVRQLLEIEIAGLAAARRNESDLADLASCLAKMEKMDESFDTESFVEADVSFHMLLARAAHNPLLWLLMETVADIMRDVRRIGSQVPGSPARAFRHHTAIFRAVKGADSDKARDKMRIHLGESYKTMTQAMKRIEAVQE
jgi:GntR family transcriptional repressor for pyruvate dehydrogenase complex